MKISYYYVNQTFYVKEERIYFIPLERNPSLLKRLNIYLQQQKTDHLMKKLNQEMFDVIHANTERLRNSTVPFIQ